MCAKQLDQIVDFYKDEDIVRNLEESNKWCKVESVYRLGTTSKMIKIRFRTPEMAQRAIEEGIYILNQSMPSRNIEKEIYVKIKPCYNCYEYDHITKDCAKERKTICAFCAEANHRQSDYTNTEPKCINCGGAHRTLVAVCPKRKQIIKERSKQIRERSRSRSTMRASGHTYAEAATAPTGVEIPLNRQSVEQTKKITTTILTAAVSSHYFESIKPGMFQKSVDRILQANGLPKVLIPIQDILEGCGAIINELVNDIVTPLGRFLNLRWLWQLAMALLKLWRSHLCLQLPLLPLLSHQLCR